MIRHRFESSILSAAFLLTALAAPAVAQVPADAVFSDFAPIGDFLFELDGEPLEHAEIYFSQKGVAYLVMAPELASPILISPRTRTVETVSFMKVAKRDDGQVDILADAALDRLGSFQLDGQQVVFELGGKEAKLRPRPPLLGDHPPAALLAYKPEYRSGAESYNPQPLFIRDLENRQGVKVRVFLGTWCEVCTRIVPRILKVEEALGGSDVRFEYYGLPQPMSDDPITGKEDIRGVPTVVVYVAGKEVGRLSGGDLNAPEAAISKLLNELG